MPLPLQSLIERVVARGGPSALAAATRRGQRLILAYHNVVPDGQAACGERSLHLPLARFREQLDALERSHEVVGLEALLADPVDARRPRVAITFDDAYRGCVALALPELARRGLPATVFVAPGLLGRDGCWWDLLADPGTGTLPEGERDHVLRTLRGDQAAAMAWQGARATAMPTTMGIATEAELDAAARLPGVRFGAHSWSHRNLAALDDAALAEELAPPLAWLRARYEAVLPWLAFPYGLHTPGVTSGARAAGYAGVLRIDGGWVRGADVAAGYLPRLNVPASISTDRFMIKTRGLFPLR